VFVCCAIGSCVAVRDSSLIACVVKMHVLLLICTCVSFSIYHLITNDNAYEYCTMMMESKHYIAGERLITLFPN